MGVDGTVRSRLSSLPNRVLAKTGTMSGVSCLSGYVQTESGRWLAFSILTNGYIGSSAPSRTLQDQLCMAMAHSE
jgi:D-alanyl-D-alanine carboxypeptidase/D-alanyl-D-alanine-endopeptidase (penicillin-binding protein 4)